MEEKLRTRKQQNSLQLYCRELAGMLNEAGISQKVFFESLEADYTENTIKDLFKSYARKKYGKDSTTKLTTKEMMDLYEEINRHTSKFGIHLPWPSQTDVMIREGKYY